MDKRYAYTGALAQDQDVLRTNLFAEIALGKIAQALIGNGPAVRGFACAPTAPPSLAVSIGVGEIYALAALLPAAFGSIAQDLSSDHQIVKQGILMDPVTRSTPAPGTSGHSINYLIQFAFSESDTDSTVLQYWNPQNVNLPLPGPGGSGTSQPQTRRAGAQISAKAGTSATTGTQVTPSPDAGYVGLWVVTVANGQGTVTSGNIGLYPGAPFLAAGSGIRPAVAVNRTTNQSIPTTTNTKVLFTTLELDTHGGWNAANNRFLPQVAGYYLVTAGIDILVSVDQAACQVGIWKNGVAYRAGAASRMSGTAHTGAEITVPLLYLNGSTDYIEVLAYQDTGASQNMASAWMHAVRIL